MSNFFKDLASVGLSKILIIVFGLLNTVLIARLLGPTANGVIGSLSVYPSLFMTIGSLGIRQSATYFVGQKMYRIDDIKRAIVNIWFITSIVCVLACFSLIYFFSSNGNNLILVALSVIPIPFSLFNTYSSGIFLGQNNISGFNRINWLPTMITFVFNIILVWIFKFNISGALIATLIGNISISFLFAFKEDFFKYFNFKDIDFVLIKSMLKLGLIYAVSLLIINLNYKLDVILLDRLSNNYEIGIYGKGAALMEYLWQIPMLLSSIIFARSANAKDGKAFSYKVLSLLRISFIIVFVASVFLFALAPYIVLLLFGEEFNASVSVLRLLLPGVLLMTIVKVLYVDLAGKGNLWGSIKSMTIGIIINILLNIILIPKYGANGSAFSSAVSYSIASILFLYYYINQIGLSFSDVVKFSSEDKVYFDKIIKKFKR